MRHVRNGEIIGNLKGARQQGHQHLERGDLRIHAESTVLRLQVPVHFLGLGVWDLGVVGGNERKRRRRKETKLRKNNRNGMWRKKMEE